MEEAKKESEKQPETKESLTKDELQLLVNVVAQAQVKVVDSPKFIELVNKLSRMVG